MTVRLSLFGAPAIHDGGESFALPFERRNQLLMDLSANLRAIVSQRLVRTEDGKGRKAAIEILINTPTISERVPGTS